MHIPTSMRLLKLVMYIGYFLFTSKKYHIISPIKRTPCECKLDFSLFSSLKTTKKKALYLLSLLYDYVLIIYCKMKTVLRIPKKHAIIIAYSFTYRIHSQCSICICIVISQVLCYCWLFIPFQKRKV